MLGGIMKCAVNVELVLFYHFSQGLVYRKMWGQAVRGAKLENIVGFEGE